MYRYFRKGKSPCTAIFESFWREIGFWLCPAYLFTDLVYEKWLLVPFFRNTTVVIVDALQPALGHTAAWREFRDCVQAVFGE